MLHAGQTFGATCFNSEVCNAEVDFIVQSVDNVNDQPVCCADFSSYSISVGFDATAPCFECNGT